jgi:hypothetical protein
MDVLMETASELAHRAAPTGFLMKTALWHHPIPSRTRK